MLWAGYGYPHGKIMAPPRISEEDCGGKRLGGSRGRRVSPRQNSVGRKLFPRLVGLERAERARRRRNGGRFERTPSCCFLPASGWKDAFSRGRTTPGASIGRFARALSARKGLELPGRVGGDGFRGEPPVRLKPDMEAEYAGGSFRLSARSACGIEEGAPVLAECSAALSLGAVRQPRFAGRLVPPDGRRRVLEGCARLEAPTASGLFHVSAGTDEWSTGSERPEWEFRFDLRVRFP
jgi:hypothetical protein